MGVLSTEDRILTAVIGALLAGVFVLDLLTPLGIAIWALYVLPLGLSRWLSLRYVIWVVAGASTALIILGYLYSPPGASFDVAVINRSLGVVVVWIAAFFLKVDRA
ncbi:MAG TPA: hypothetical protein VKB81_03190 [Nitrospira sp.]|nr:hypothetical protein [Nitrospira sp.]